MTFESGASPRRRYDDACGTAHALDLVGDRWALLVMRELLLGPKRFNDLRADLPGISANVLTQRLEGLEAAGILVRRRLPPPGAAQVYELTAWGYESEPIVQALGRWATRSPWHDPTLPLSGVSLMLSFRTMFEAGRAQGVAGSVGFRFGREGFLVRVADGALTAQRGEPDDADVVFTGTPPLVAAAMYGHRSFASLEPMGLSVRGDSKLAARFAKLFPLPTKVGELPESPEPSQ